jgi:hypothetical protein
MTIPRLLILGSLISLCVARGSAQTLPQSASDSSRPGSTLSQNAEADTDFFALFEDWQSSSDSTAGGIRREQDSGKMPEPVHTQHTLTLEQNEMTCLTLRTYRVARVSPDSDTTEFAGYSTCQPGSRFQLKTAVDSKEIEAR